MSQYNIVDRITSDCTPFGGINCHSVKRLFSEGHLHPTALLLCPHSAIQNLPQPRQLRPSLVGPSAMMVGQVVQGVRLAEARGRPLGSSPSSNITSGSPDNEFQLLTEILIHRANHTPDDRLFTVYNTKGQEVSTLTCSQLLRRSERLAVQLKEKGKAQVGTIVALLYPPGGFNLIFLRFCQVKLFLTRKFFSSSCFSHTLHNLHLIFEISNRFMM
ncbi:unnamed protein product [Schistosoma curassoni]|uniref:AMP-binding domain-containing protein n=1 Tax=Schistosoma curassoni TaxID=6186 RepID=A0A183L3P6_9TREM|nr:unnamed protein product [Schistosoma curassoni]